MGNAGVDIDMEKLMRRQEYTARGFANLAAMWRREPLPYPKQERAPSVSYDINTDTLTWRGELA